MRDHERTAAARRTSSALAEALAELSAEDRLILALRFRDGLTVAAVAAALHLPQRPLYTRIERALVQLLRRLEAVGIGAADVGGLVGGLGRAGVGGGLHPAGRGP